MYNRMPPRVTKRKNREHKHKNWVTNHQNRAAQQASGKVWAGVKGPAAPHHPGKNTMEDYRIAERGALTTRPKDTTVRE